LKKAHKPRYRINVCAGDQRIGIYRLTFIKGRKRVKPYKYTDIPSVVAAEVRDWVGRNDVFHVRRTLKFQEAA
jgi:hypothetical protein